MFRSILIGAAALALASCGVAPHPVSPSSNARPIATPTPAATSPASVVDKAADALERANAAVDRAWTAYVTIRNVADLVVPFLSADRAAQVKAIEARVEDGFARARIASDLSVQAVELAKAATAARQLEALTVDPD